MLPLTSTATFTVDVCGGKFTFRYPSAKQYVEAAELDSEESLKALGSLKDVMQKLVDVLSLGLVGWELVQGAEPVSFNPAKLPELLTFDELWELYYAWRKGSRLSPLEKKDSLSA